MARGAIPVSALSRAGVAPPSETNGDATNNHSVVNDGATFLLVRNSNGASTARTVTFRPTSTVDGQSVTRAVSIAAAASRYFGPFPTGIYGRSLLVDVDNAELKLSAFRLPSS